MKETRDQKKILFRTWKVVSEAEEARLDAIDIDETDDVSIDECEVIASPVPACVTDTMQSPAASEVTVSSVSNKRKAPAGLRKRTFSECEVIASPVPACDTPNPSELVSNNKESSECEVIASTVPACDTPGPRELMSKNKKTSASPKQLSFVDACFVPTNTGTSEYQPVSKQRGKQTSSNKSGKKTTSNVPTRVQPTRRR